jgi:hypothetical protein
MFVGNAYLNWHHEQRRIVLVEKSQLAKTYLGAKYGEIET